MVVGKDCVKNSVTHFQNNFNAVTFIFLLNVDVSGSQKLEFVRINDSAVNVIKGAQRLCRIIKISRMEEAGRYTKIIDCYCIMNEAGTFKEKQCLLNRKRKCLKK